MSQSSVAIWACGEASRLREQQGPGRGDKGLLVLTREQSHIPEHGPRSLSHYLLTSYLLFVDTNVHTYTHTHTIAQKMLGPSVNILNQHGPCVVLGVNGA